MLPATYLFDIGNVIIGFDFELAVKRVQDQCAVAPEQILPKLTPLTDGFERGTMSVEEYVAEASRRVGYSGTVENFVKAFAEIFTLNEPVARLIEELDAAGRPLFLLSNTNAIHVPYFTREWASVFDRFDGAIYSHEVGRMKPEPEIYKIAIEKLDLDPTETIYIDDRAENITAGAAFGLQAIQYDPANHAALEEVLSG